MQYFIVLLLRLWRLLLASEHLNWFGIIRFVDIQARLFFILSDGRLKVLVFTFLRTVIAMEELLCLTAHYWSPVGRLLLLLIEIADFLVIVWQLLACFLREESIKSGSVQLILDTLQFKLLLAGPTASLLSRSSTLRRDIVL